MRRPRPAAACAALLCLALVAGCSSGHSRRATSARGAGRLPAADRSAYVEIASDSGVLRVTTVRAALGLSGRIDRTPIEAASLRLAKLHPQSAELARLRAELSAACAAAVRPPSGRAALRRTARDAVAATDTVNAALRTYAARHPAVAQAIPD